MNIPSRFTYGDPSTSKKYVLKLKNDLYGLKKATMNWYFKIREGLKHRLFKKSEIYPFLLVKNDLICLIQVNETIFFARYQKIIDKMVSLLKKFLTSLMRDMSMLFQASKSQTLMMDQLQ